MMPQHVMSISEYNMEEMLLNAGQQIPYKVKIKQPCAKPTDQVGGKDFPTITYPNYEMKKIKRQRHFERNIYITEYESFFIVK